MAVQAVSVLLVILSSIVCSGTQQGVSSTQAGQTLQIQPNIRKYNKHTVTEKPCTTAGSSTTGTRKDKPDSGYSDAQDYAPVGGGAAGSGYPYAPYPYPQPAYQPVGNYPYRLQYPYEPQYPAEVYPQPPPPPPPPGPYGYAPSYYPVAPAYPAFPYHPAAYPAAYPATPPQQLYDQSATVVDAYRTPLQQADQPQFFKQPVAGPAPYGPYAPQQPSVPHYYRAHAYNRPATLTSFLQQRDATATATTAANPTAAEPSQQYEPQSPPAAAGPFDSNQYHHY